MVLLSLHSRRYNMKNVTFEVSENRKLLPSVCHSPEDKNKFDKIFFACMPQLLQCIPPFQSTARGRFTVSNFENLNVQSRKKWYYKRFASSK